MTTLLIDIGNTHLQWGMDSEAGFAFGGASAARPDLLESLFARQWDKLKPEYLFMSCVGNEIIKQQIFNMAKSNWGIQAESLQTPKQGCGISNAYASPETLGSDRWAAMVAAFAQTNGPVCVVDSGTAVTLDVVSQAGEHLGGLILPGYGLMRDCLQKGTRLDFEAAPLPTQPALGQSTEQCTQQGTAIAISSMVDKMYETLTNELAGLSLILTGGDAGLLQSRICHESILEPHLVLKGLAIIHRSFRSASQI